jgi:hypothetical protein
VVGARVDKGPMPGVAKQATFKPGNQARAEAVDERDVVRLANHVPNLPLVVLGLLGEERGLNDGGEVLGEDAVSAAWVRGVRGEGERERGREGEGRGGEGGEEGRPTCRGQARRSRHSATQI